VPPASDPVLKELARRIRSARESAGLTQEVVAARSGIDYKRYQRIEHGVVNATVRTLARVAEALGLDFWKLLGQGRR
jgi:transcriptional regulator with XRE-family HTH domain